MFNAKYMSDAEVWLKIDEIIKKHHETQKLLAQPEIITDPCRYPELAKRLHELDKICLIISGLKKCEKDIRELEEMMIEEENESDLDELKQLYEELVEPCQDKASQIYHWLLQEGYIDKELEDETDLDILKFIDYAGPEYAWRLGINIGISVEESSRRLKALLEKGLLERVEGNMLGNYHREKSWTKHMNHTYYRITREGRLYLRRLRQDLDN